MGLTIKCPLCPALPPQQKKGEDFIWYGYRKWRWLANHIVEAHNNSAALSYRRIAAAEKRFAQAKKVKAKRVM